ncbi:NUDIX hydrolase [Salipaludibacillus keqinensis]|uniref:NUDIX hydrolase n=1 Tax=Salipaludibacillus keqinensis TaxID=2045207 RepID=A0A323TWK9_9BACI|nr:NUDIX domain-containing protein [Salipaludibacillus keqinensis]PYZ93935.1 NUDIX hydrolase [Salipaludibacillus keqinensis]
MDSEKITVFDENQRALGTETRGDIHQKGLWHETFHCWFITEDLGESFIYLQLRSDRKKDFSSLLDITAAGHLLANESVENGIREVKEELGIDLHFSDLTKLAVIKDVITMDSFIDNEFAHVFLYKMDDSIQDFQLQQDEVSGMVRAKFQDFYDLCFKLIEKIGVEGFEINSCEEQIEVNKTITLLDLVPHQDAYLQEVVTRIKDEIS